MGDSLPSGVQMLLDAHPSLQLDAARVKVRCSLTGHEMPVREEVLRAYLASPKYVKARDWYSADFSQYLPWIVPHGRDSRKLWCRLTKRPLNRIPAEVAAHVAGRRFKFHLAAAERRRTRGADPFAAADDEGSGSGEDDDDDEEGAANRSSSAHRQSSRRAARGGDDDDSNVASGDDDEEMADEGAEEEEEAGVLVRAGRIIDEDMAEFYPSDDDEDEDVDEDVEQGAAGAGSAIPPSRGAGGLHPPARLPKQSGGPRTAAGRPQGESGGNPKVPAAAAAAATREGARDVATAVAGGGSGGKRFERPATGRGGAGGKKKHMRR